jgi:hypothetical protein
MVAACGIVAGSFRAERPRQWSPGRVSFWGGFRNFDLHPDGQRFAVLKPVDESDESGDHVVLVQNFFDELRRLAPAASR